MRVPSWLLCGLVLLGCNGNATKAGRVAQPPEPEKPSATSPWPDGPVRGDEARITIAFYFARAPKVAAEKLLTGACSKEAAALVAPAKSTIEHAKIAELAPPSEELLGYFGRGLSDADRKQVQESLDPVLLLVHGPAAQAVPTLRATTMLAACLQKQLNAFLWDDDTREMFSAAAFDARRVNAWPDDGTVDVSRHILFHAYMQDDLMREVTLGMVKFGLPDLAVRGVAPNFAKPMGTLLNAAAQTLVETAPKVTNGQLLVDLAALKNAHWVQIRKEVTGRMGGGRVTLPVRTGKKDEGDPDNRMLEIFFETRGAISATEQQGVNIARFLGANEDQVARADVDDPEIAAAVARAKAGLKKLRTRFAKGLRPSEHLAVKAPFTTNDGKGTEWMWLQVTRWEGDKLSGTLDNDPEQVSSLKRGAQVETTVDAIGDYVLSDGNKAIEGLDAAKVFEARERAK